MSVIIIDMNPVVQPFSVYPLGAAMLAEEASRLGLKPVCISWHDVVAGQIENFISRKSTRVIALSIRNIDNTSAIETEFFFNHISSYLQLLAGRYADISVLGGSGFSLFPASILQKSRMRYGVVGRNIEVWQRILDVAVRGVSFSGVEGLTELDSDGACKINSSESTLKSLPLLPAGEWFLERQSWDRVGFDTQSGCRQQCVYCCYPSLSGRTKRYRDISEVWEYIERWNKRGIREFDIVDDVFNDDSDHVDAFCSHWSAHKGKFFWRAYLRPEGIDRSFADLLASAGCLEAILGVDSLADSVLAKLNKGFDTRSIEIAVKNLKQAGLVVTISLIIGSEFDSYLTILETTKHLQLVSPDRISVQFGIRVLPYSPLAKKWGKTEFDLFKPVFSMIKDMRLEVARSLFESIAGNIERRPIV
jgi:hypothetical protein